MEVFTIETTALFLCDDAKERDITEAVYAGFEPFLAGYMLAAPVFSEDKYGFPFNIKLINCIVKKTNIKSGTLKKDDIQIAVFDTHELDIHMVMEFSYIEPEKVFDESEKDFSNQNLELLLTRALVDFTSWAFGNLVGFHSFFKAYEDMPVFTIVRGKIEFFDITKINEIMSDVKDENIKNVLQVLIKKLKPKKTKTTKKKRPEDNDA